MSNLETRVLGRTNRTVTRLGAGGHFTNGPLAHEDIPRRVAELHHLLDRGVTYFDVQWDPEELASAEVMKARGSEFTVAWPLHAMNKQDPKDVKQYVIDYCEDHRRRYGIEHVDILLWVALAFEDDAAGKRIVAAEQAFAALKAQGFCDHFAFSCHESPQTALRAITEFDVFEAMMVPYSPLYPAAGRELLPAARQRRVGTVVMKPFGGGGGLFNLAWSGQLDHPALAGFQGSPRPYQAALRWVLADANVDCTVPGAHSIQQIDDLCEAVACPRGKQDDEILDLFRRVMRETTKNLPLRSETVAGPGVWE